MTKIIAGSSSKKLAQQLSASLSIAQVEAFIERFEDEELRVQLADGVHEEDVIIVQSTSKPAIFVSYSSSTSFSSMMVVAIHGGLRAVLSSLWSNCTCGDQCRA